MTFKRFVPGDKRHRGLTIKVIPVRYQIYVSAALRKALKSDTVNVYVDMDSGKPQIGIEKGKDLKILGGNISCRALVRFLNFKQPQRLRMRFDESLAMFITVDEEEPKR